jgi:hypothetical protein
VRVSQRVFERFKPSTVRAIRKGDRHTCACIHHVNTSCLRRAWQAHRVAMLATRPGLQFVQPLPSNLHELMELCLCPLAPGEVHHRLACLKGEFPAVGLTVQLTRLRSMRLRGVAAST